MNQLISSSHFSNSSSRVASSRVSTHSYTPMSQVKVRSVGANAAFTTEFSFRHALKVQRKGSTP